MSFASQMLFACAFGATLSSIPAFACQVECLILSTTAKSAVLLDANGVRLAKAEVIIRDASKNADGPECFCGRFGPIVNHLWTDENGRIDLGELQLGEYWITYMHPRAGESFHVSIDKGKSSRTPLELQIDHFANRCYLVDIERNETKPIGGWPEPVSQTNAEKN